MTSHQLDLFDQPVKQRTFHGHLCKRCGGTERYTSNRDCIQCLRQRALAIRLADPEAYRAKSRERSAKNREATLRRVLTWQKANPERQRETRKRWAAKNQEKNRAAKKAWKVANPSKNREALSRRRAFGKTAFAIWLKASDQHAAIQALYAQARELGMHVDHDIPLRGCMSCGAIGLHVLANLQLLPAKENLTKSARCTDCLTQPPAEKYPAS